jgi:dTDP-4-dehydrorhamnose reductase
MRILITGAGGMLGRDVRKAAAVAGHEPIAFARAELDITDADAIARAVAQARPDAVINCAAWTKVDAAEEHEPQATAVNGAGAGNIAAAAARAGAWTVHVSSDYVFDGAKREPYLESDRTRPLSAYGRSKLAGEDAVADAAPDAHTIVRSSWLFGAGGPCFPKTMLRLADERDELNVVDDQIGCPTFTGHLGAALVQLTGAPPPGVLHVAAAEQCSWYEFAVATVAAGERDCEVHPIDTSQFPLPAPRPAFSVMRSERGAPTLPGWSEGLRDFMTEIALVGS